MLLRKALRGLAAGILGGVALAVIVLAAATVLAVIFGEWR